METNKKIIVPTIVAVATLVLLVFGATYAYFTIGSTNNFGTKDLSATVENMAGSVVLEQVKNELSLNVTRAMMSEDNKGTTYYASENGIGVKIAKISVADEGRYACDYTIKVTKSASSLENDLYEALQNSDNEPDYVYLYINNYSYNLRLDEDLFPITYNGTISGVSKDSPQYITTDLSLTNEEWEQNYLKGKDITLTYEITEFDCYLSEADDSAPIYAVVTDERDEFQGKLLFYQNHDIVNVGDVYKNERVIAVYKNLNNTNYTSVDDVPWREDNIDYIKIVEPIRPTNIAYWFSNLGSAYTDLINLDTSKVTSMSHTFDGVSGIEFFGNDDLYFDTSNVEDMSYIFANIEYEPAGGIGLLNIEQWNTSKVTNMSHMFYNTKAELYIDFSNWDVSSVTDMSYMFAYGEEESALITNLSTWDTSNVTNMSYMFSNGAYGGFEIGDITRKKVTVNGKTYISWDTSKVTDMSYMFNEAGLYTTYNLNLSSWQVPLVTNYTNFNEGVESKITPPTWVN